MHKRKATVNRERSIRTDSTLQIEITFKMKKEKRKSYKYKYHGPTIMPIEILN